MRQRPEPAVVTWLDRQPRSSVWTTSVTVLEVRFGLQILAAGARRTTLVHSFGLLLEKIKYRIAPFDAPAAEQAADLMALRQKKGRPVELGDTMIAGIALSRHATLATHNAAHFEDSVIPLINPWRD